MKIDLSSPADSIRLSQGLQKLNFLAREIKAPSPPCCVQCFFGASIFQPHKLPLSSSLLGKGVSFPQPSHWPVWVVWPRWEKPGKPHLPVRRPESSTLCVTAKDLASHRNYWAYALRAAKSSCFTRQETECAVCNSNRLLLQRKRAFNTAQSCTCARSRSKPSLSPAAPLLNVQTTSVLHFTKDMHPDVHSCMCSLYCKYLYPAFPDFAIPWTLI